MRKYIQLDVVSLVRSGYFLVFSVVFSSGFYVMFTKLFRQQDWVAAAHQFAADYMVSMGISGALFGALIGGGIRLGAERGDGWARQVILTPLSPRRYVTAKLVSAWLLALPAVIVVFLLGLVVNNVDLGVGAWFAAAGVLWAGSLCFATIGVAIGLLVAGEATQFACLGVFFPLAMLGGLWFPITTFPDTLQKIIAYLPTRALTQIGQSIVDGTTAGTEPFVVIASWTVAAVIVAATRLRPSVLVRA
jgi:ABC-2 type transport system permease protein